MFPFIFLLPEQKKNETKRKFAVCIFLPTPALFSAEQKELATLKQLFVLNAPKSTFASRSKSEAGHSSQHCFARWSGCLFDVRLLQKTSEQKARKHHYTTNHILSNSEAHLSSPWGTRHLVEKRKEILPSFREEQKAV